MGRAPNRGLVRIDPDFRPECGVQQARRAAVADTARNAVGSRLASCAGLRPGNAAAPQCAAWDGRFRPVLGANSFNTRAFSDRPSKRALAQGHVALRLCGAIMVGCAKARTRQDRNPCTVDKPSYGRRFELGKPGPGVPGKPGAALSCPVPGDGSSAPRRNRKVVKACA